MECLLRIAISFSMIIESVMISNDIVANCRAGPTGPNCSNQECLHKIAFKSFFSMILAFLIVTCDFHPKFSKV